MDGRGSWSTSVDWSRWLQRPSGVRSVAEGGGSPHEQSGGGGIRTHGALASSAAFKTNIKDAICSAFSPRSPVVAPPMMVFSNKTTPRAEVTGAEAVDYAPSLSSSITRCNLNAPD